MKFRFNKFSITASKVLYLVPELICSESDIVTKLAPVIEMYKADLINPDIVDQEITLWMKKWEDVPKSQRGSTLATAIKECEHFRASKDRMHTSRYILRVREKFFVYERTP